MAIITSSKTKAAYDVVVVGSGAAGGQTAYTLAMGGAKVLMLEAGRDYQPPKETPMFQGRSSAPLRGVPTPDKPREFYDASIWPDTSLKGEPYTNASTQPEHQFNWLRIRMLGGRTNHWSQSAFRYGPYDFKPKSRDGLGLDWPIAYEDLAPYFDRVEMLIGVYGENQDLENLPHSPPGVLLPSPRLRAGELFVQRRARALGMPVIPARRSVLTRRLDYRTIPAKLHPNNPTAQRILADDMKGRAACFWATECTRGCAIRASYQSTTVHLPPALATGNLEIVTNAMAREVLTDDSGRATGLRYIDTITGEEHVVRARIVVLAAGAFESVRLLLNSTSARFPNGLANSSGLLGKFITNMVGVGALKCQIPLFEDLPPHNEDGAGGDHVVIPWWLYAEQKAGKLDFPRGYRIIFRTGRQMPDAETFAGLEWLSRGSYGAKFKEDARRYYGSFVTFGSPGEMIPNDATYCEIDPAVRDRWGIPVLRFHWEWSDHEKRQQVHKRTTIMALVDALGGKVNGDPKDAFERVLAKGATGDHWLGGAIMGANPRESVLNQFGQGWETNNLFVTDGAVFCSQSHLPPTLTIMALAWRAADRMLDEMGKGNL